MSSGTGLPALGADIGWPDAAATEALESRPATGSGRLAALAQWMAGVQGTAQPTVPKRARLLSLDGAAGATALDWAHRFDVDVQRIDLPEDVAAAQAAGRALADAAADEGCDLLVLSASALDAAAVTAVCLLTGAEPVSLLPRGAAAVDTAAWIETATGLRDALRVVRHLREDPDGLVTVLGSPALACAAHLIMRAAARRTPILLDGPLAAAAAVLCQDVQARCGQWVRFADTHPDPVHRRSVDDLAHAPVLDLQLDRTDGLAGVLAVGVLVTAVGVLADTDTDTDRDTDRGTSGEPESEIR